MKLNKIISGIAAAAVTASALAVSSGAALVVSSATNTGFSSTAGMWMQQIYVPGQGIDFGIDPREMGKVVFTITPDVPEDFEGGTGGAVVISSGPQNGAPEDHNWVSSQFWGVYDEDNEIFGRDPENDTNPIHTEIVGDYTYTLTVNIAETSQQVLQRTAALRQLLRQQKKLRLPLQLKKPLRQKLQQLPQQVMLQQLQIRRRVLRTPVLRTLQ